MLLKEINDCRLFVETEMVVNPEGYVVPSPFSEDIENGIKQRLLSDLVKF